MVRRVVRFNHIIPTQVGSDSINSGEGMNGSSVPSPNNVVTVPVSESVSVGEVASSPEGELPGAVFEEVQKQSENSKEAFLQLPSEPAPPMPKRSVGRKSKKAKDESRSEVKRGYTYIAVSFEAYELFDRCKSLWKLTSGQVRVTSSDLLCKALKTFMEQEKLVLK